MDAEQRREARFQHFKSVMLSIVWVDRSAAGDDCISSLESFIKANSDGGLGEDQMAQVMALKPGESVRLDWTDVRRLAEGECVVCGEVDAGHTCCPPGSDAYVARVAAAESRRLDEQRAANDRVNAELNRFRSRR